MPHCPITNRSAPLALMVAHVAGMIDLVALPVWIGTLMQHFHFDAQRAGTLVTLYLLFAVASSTFFAQRFDRTRGRTAASAGFVLATAAFYALSQMSSFSGMCVAHAAEARHSALLHRRQASLFSDTATGANASAMVYSLIPDIST